MSTPIKKIPLSHIEDIKGSAIFPESGNNGDVLVKDNTTEEGVKWINDKTQVITDSTLQGDGGSISLGLSASKNLEIASKISTVTIDRTLKGNGKDISLGLSEAKNAEINGKISKQGINLGDTGNIPEMKTGDISGIYRGHGASNAVYEFSPFFHMVTADTYAQIHINYVDGEMSYRAGTAVSGYSPIRKSWDNVNLVNPATQGWVSERYVNKYENAAGIGFTNGNFNEAPYIFHSSGNYAFLATQGWVTTQTTPATQAEVEASTGTHDKPTLSEPATENRKFLSLFNFFKLIQKLRYIHLLPNSTTAIIANRLRSDGSNLYFANSSAIESKLLYDNEGYISVTGDVTVDNSYHGRIVRVSANCNITLSSTLRNDFIAYFVVIGNYTITFVEGSGVTFYAPYGKKMLEGNTCYAQKSSDIRFDLIGTLTPA